MKGSVIALHCGPDPMVGTMVIIGKPKCNRMNWFQGGMGQVVALHSQSYVDLVAIMDSRVNAAFRMETHRDPWHGHFIAVFLEMKDMGSPTLDLYECKNTMTGQVNKP